MHASNLLYDKKIFVTGASSGIGQEISINISNNQGALYLTGRNTLNLENTANLINQNHIKSFVGDLTDLEFLKRMAMEIEPIDGIVLNAGIINYKPMRFIKKDDYIKMFDVNYFAPNFLLQELVNNKKLKNDASIIFISSLSAIDGGSIGLGAYSGSKAALIATSKVWALEMSKNKIRVNSIVPGMIQTPMTEKSIKTLTLEALELDQKKYPLGYGKPEDISGMVIYLLSDNSKWVTGSTFIIDGGFSRK